jgi:hypothetical protein
MGAAAEAGRGGAVAAVLGQQRLVVAAVEVGCSLEAPLGLAAVAGRLAGGSSPSGASRGRGRTGGT